MVPIAPSLISALARSQRFSASIACSAATLPAKIAMTACMF
jgi:hypothetical protein